MYLRFVILEIDRASGRRQGTFPSAYRLLREEQLPADVHGELQDLMTWFEEHLKKPARFAWGSKRHAHGNAISWFKDSATSHLRRIRAICRVLNEHGIATKMLTSARPGYIVYEDEHQVTAVPFAETPT